MDKQYKKLSELYNNNIKCAESFGMIYCEDESDWWFRLKKWSKTVYHNDTGKHISSSKHIAYINDLVVPPQWKDVRISPSKKNHILATWYDNKWRKQYIYNENWSEARSLINSYTLIVFWEYLWKIRTYYKKLMKSDFDSREYLMGLFIFLLDETVIRVGNRHYLDTNGSIWLSTLQVKHIKQKKNSIFLEFPWKSWKNHNIRIRDAKLRKILARIKDKKSKFIFTYKDWTQTSCITPDQINSEIKNISSDMLSAKDFRTWYASYIVFEEMVWEIDSKTTDKMRKKLLLKSFDRAAEKLWNTRTMIRNSYAHPDMIDTVQEKTFLDYLSEIWTPKKKRNLSMMETKFLCFLKILYQENKYF